MGNARKVQSGGGQLLVSIPPGVARRLGIEAGDMLDLEDREGEIVLRRMAISDKFQSRTA